MKTHEAGGVEEEEGVPGVEIQQRQQRVARDVEIVTIEMWIQVIVILGNGVTQLTMTQLNVSDEIQTHSQANNIIPRHRYRVYNSNNIIHHKIQHPSQIINNSIMGAKITIIIMPIIPSNK